MSRITRLGLVIIAALVATILVLPVSADLKTVTPGKTVFIGEEGLDVSAIFGSGSCDIAYFAPGQKLDEAPSATKNILSTSFNVLSSDFSGRTGLWYLYINGTADQTKYVRVEEPRIEVRVRNFYDNDVTGKSVVRGDKVNFRVETNLYEIQQRDTSETFPFHIKVESPGGVVYTSMYISNTETKELVNLPVNTGLWLWSAYAPTGLWDTGAKDGSGNNRYVAGTYKAFAECNVNSLKDNNDKGKSQVVEVTIASDTLDLTTNKETATRGSQFIVTVKGTPSVTYNLFVKSVGSDVAPKIISSQEGVVKINDYQAEVTTNSGGTRSIGFSTDKDTRAKRWTIRVEEISGDRYDEVTVDVKAGTLSVTADGSGVYYLGQEVKLTGTNTETDTVYFFITGPNLPSSGGSLNNPRTAAGFVTANVKDDKTFEYKWNTESLSIDSGSYTVYAVSEPANRDELDDAQYDTVSINFRKPFITVDISPNNIAAGDKFFVRGNAGVETSSGIAIWIMGKNYFTRDVVSVETDGTFEHEIKQGVTENLASGQYFVVVQHPMYDGIFDVDIGTGGNADYVIGSYPVSDSRKFKYAGSGALQGSDAANALVDAIDDPAIDDTYARSQFMVSQATITVNPVDTVKIGDEFTITGYTNLAVGNNILVEVVSASFGPTKKTASGEFSGFSGTTKVVAGTGEWNKFAIEVSADNFIKDEYIITASSVTVPVSGSSTFQVLEFVPTTVPTTKPTTVPTTVVTTIPTTVIPTTTAIPTTVPTPEETPTVPQESPGFGALIAVGGIGTVWYMLHRKRDE